MGGKRVSSALALNVAGPSLSSIKRFSAEIRHRLEPGQKHMLSNFKSVAKLWKVLIEQRRRTHSDVGAILCELSEDETGILPIPEYSQRRNCVLGLCGPAGEEHKCDDDFLPQVTHWDDVVRLMSTSVYAHYARIIMVCCNGVKKIIVLTFKLPTLL